MIGMRNIKTALSVSIVILTVDILHNFGFEMFTGFFAILAAINAMQSSINETRKAGFARTFGTFIGSIIGICLYPFNILVFHGHLEPLFAFVGTVFTIAIVSRINQQAVFMGCALFLSSLTNETGVVSYMVIRTIETAYGALVTVIINETIKPPVKHHQNINHSPQNDPEDENKDT